MANLIWDDFKGKISAAGVYFTESESGDAYYLETNNDACRIPKTNSTEIADYETNFQAEAVDELVQKVSDIFSSDEKTPKFAKHKSTFSSGTCTLELKCPGTFPDVSRYLKDGHVVTDGFAFGDAVTKIEVVDKDNLMGYGAGAVLKTYHDDSTPIANAGWYLWPSHSGHGKAHIRNAGGWGEFVAGLYLVVTVESSIATNAYINIFWAINE
jgi:hypothetical protein